METKEYISRLEELGVQGNALHMVITPHAKKLLSRIRKRIFTDGLNSAGQPIGKYSTEPMYATRKQFAKPGAFVPTLSTAQRGARTFNVKRKVKTMYLPSGYKQLRDVQGLQTNHVDLKYRGKTRRAYVLEEKEDQVLLGLNTPLAAQIKGEQEDRFQGFIFRATEGEIELYNTGVNASLSRLTRGLLQGVSAQSLVETPETDNLIDYGII